MKLALVLAAALALGACGARDRPIVIRVETTPCPAVAPPVLCPDLSDPGPIPRKEELRDAWLDARTVHAECRAALEVWNTTWRACAAPKKGEKK